MENTASGTYPTGRAMATVFDQHRRSARKRLIEFLGRVSREDFIRPLPEAADKSLRDLVVHMIDANAFWISVLQNRPHEKLAPQSFPTVESICPVIEEVCDRIHNVLSEADDAWFARPSAFSMPGGRAEPLVPSLVAVHMLTHEYHHKGQIVALARMLGYEPPDTDLY